MIQIRALMVLNPDIWDKRPSRKKGVGCNRGFNCFVVIGQGI